MKVQQHKADKMVLFLSTVSLRSLYGAALYSPTLHINVEQIALFILSTLQTQLTVLVTPPRSYTKPLKEKKSENYYFLAVHKVNNVKFQLSQKIFCREKKYDHTIFQCTSTKANKDSLNQQPCRKTCRKSFRSKYPATLKYAEQYKSQDQHVWVSFLSYEKNDCYRRRSQTYLWKIKLHPHVSESTVSFSSFSPACVSGLWALHTERSKILVFPGRRKWFRLLK